MSECRNNHMQTHWNGCDCSRAADRREARLAALREARAAVERSCPELIAQTLPAAMATGYAIAALDRLIAAESGEPATTQGGLTNSPS
jgi:hypothetical protein